jgi:hypothetical protein
MGFARFGKLNFFGSRLRRRVPLPGPWRGSIRFDPNGEKEAGAPVREIPFSIGNRYAGRTV